MCVIGIEEQCNKIILTAKILGFEEEISEGKLINVIMNTLKVIDKRAINNWKRALTAFGYVELKGEHVYKINRKEA